MIKIEIIKIGSLKNVATWHSHIVPNIGDTCFMRDEQTLYKVQARTISEKNPDTIVLYCTQVSSPI